MSYIDNKEDRRIWIIGSHARLVKDHSNRNMYNLEILNKHDFWTRVQWIHVSNAQNLINTKLPRVEEEIDSNRKEW